MRRDSLIGRRAGRFSQILLLSLVAALAANGLSTLAPPAVAATTASGVSYSYDASGRLVGATDPTGSASYDYDSVGNVRSIARYGATQVSVLSLTPTSGGSGDRVTVSGAGFDATAANDTVKLNGVTATITSASTSRLTITVPAGATTGPVSVTSPLGTSSGPAFTVISNVGPSIATVSPRLVVPGSSVTVTGTNFDPAATNDVGLSIALVPPSAVRLPVA